MAGFSIRSFSLFDGSVACFAKSSEYRLRVTDRGLHTPAMLMCPDVNVYVMYPGDRIFILCIFTFSVDPWTSESWHCVLGSASISLACSVYNHGGHAKSLRVQKTNAPWYCDVCIYWV